MRKESDDIVDSLGKGDLHETERFLLSHGEQATEFYSVISGIGDEVPNKQSCKHVHICPACEFSFVLYR